MRRRLVCHWLRVRAKDTEQKSLRSALKLREGRLSSSLCACVVSLLPPRSVEPRTVKILLYSPAHICLRTARKEEEEELTAKVASKLRPAFQVSPGLWI